MDAIITKLDELIAATKAATIPPQTRYVDAEGIASLLQFKPRYVAEQIVNRPDFPAPFRLDGTGHPRWPLVEVLKWVQSNRTKKI